MQPRAHRANVEFIWRLSTSTVIKAPHNVASCTHSLSQSHTAGRGRYVRCQAANTLSHIHTLMARHQEFILVWTSSILFIWPPATTRPIEVTDVHGPLAFLCPEIKVEAQRRLCSGCSQTLDQVAKACSARPDTAHFKSRLKTQFIIFLTQLSFAFFTSTFHLFVLLCLCFAALLFGLMVCLTLIVQHCCCV